MHTTLLINKIDIDNHTDQMRNIFFLIGNYEECELKIMDLFKDDPLYQNALEFRYNGFVVKAKVSDIPNLVRKIVSSGVDLYNVYELYEPK
ncbi:MAG: hypothetical protein Q4P29_02635 [Tissierellia bacterium]|nr:hypothetical protein [Tissierellia bacterium]